MVTSGSFAAACLHCKDAASSEDAYSYVCSRLSELLGQDFLSSTSDSEYVFLIHIKDDDLVHQLDTTAKEHEAILGISQEFSDLSQTSKYYTQAKDSAMAAANFADFSGAALYDDMKLYIMFDIFSKTDAGKNMIDPQVKILAGSDAEKNTDFMRTLFCWLLNSQHAAAAAKQLGVHRNTLDNRLAKIGELIDTNWNSSTYSTCMLYSLYITLNELGQLEYFR